MIVNVCSEVIENSTAAGVTMIPTDATALSRVRSVATAPLKRGERFAIPTTEAWLLPWAVAEDEADSPEHVRTEKWAKRGQGDNRSALFLKREFV